MPGRKEFTYPVGGSGDSPISTTQTEAFEVDNYREGDSVATTAYPINIDPAFIIQHLAIFAIPSDKTLDLVTSSGTTINGVEPEGATAYIDGLEIDSVTVNDPAASGGKTSMLYIGE